MKTYSIAELKKISVEQGYKICSLENSQGEKIQPFNVPTKATLTKHLDVITNRLKTDLYPDGLYYIVLNNYVANSKGAKKFPIVKGTYTDTELKEQTVHIPKIIPTQSHEVLTWDSALKLHQELTDLKSQVKQLEYENNLLQQQLEEIEDIEPLNEGIGSNSIISFLKETIPSFMPIVEKHFELEEKKLNLEHLKLNNNNVNLNKSNTRIKIIPGTQNHLNLIEHYFNTDQDNLLNIELDKLQNVNPELYKNVCVKLDITENEG